MAGDDAGMQSYNHGSIWFDRGNSFTPLTAFYGGPFIAFFSVEIDCKELYWLDKIYRNGEAPYQRDLEALQINFNDSDVVWALILLVVRLLFDLHF